jgi:Skp family chaperone for outer membrane proteins
VKIRTVLPWVAAACFFVAPTISAQAGSASGSSAQNPPTKIAVIDIQAAIANTAEGKAGLAELQSQFAPKKADMDKTQKDIEGVEQRLRAGANTLSDEEKANLSVHDQLLQKKYQRQQDELNDEANEAQSELFDRIGRKMLDVSDRYARENGIAAVFSSSGQQTPILIYRDNQIDITKDIVNLYDKQYPVKATAVGSPAPATQKPATPGTPAQTPPKKPGGGPGGQN